VDTRKVKDIAVYYGKEKGFLHPTAVTIDGAYLPVSAVEVITLVADQMGNLRLTIPLNRVRLVVEDNLEQESEDLYAVPSKPLQ
jgi:hypothetical protein